MRRGKTAAGKGLPTGITRTPFGYRAFVRVEGELHSQRFGPDTRISLMVAWREERRVRVRIGAPIAQAGAEDTFRRDAKLYLLSVGGMASYRSRADDIARWVHLFRDRPRSSIRTIEIRTQLAAWRKTYAANTVNHRLTALKQLWQKLDEGLDPMPPNPVASVQKYRDDSADRPPRALSYALIRLIFEAMRPGPQKARLQLMAWAGWPQATIRRLRKEDVLWAPRWIVYLQGREKGKGTKAEWTTLSRRGWAALRIHARWKEWGDFDGDNMRKTFRRAAAKVHDDPRVPPALRTEAADVTPYDLRHSYLTLVTTAQPDDRASSSIARHADQRMIGRYTEGATNPRVAVAMVAVNAYADRVKIAAKRTAKLPPSRQKLPAGEKPM